MLKSEEALGNPPSTYEPDSPYLATQRMLRADFAKGMREAKICVFDSSLERKLIRKYGQSSILVLQP